MNDVKRNKRKEKDTNNQSGEEGSQEIDKYMAHRRGSEKRREEKMEMEYSDVKKLVVERSLSYKIQISRLEGIRLTE